jgi:hypothetical protein
MPRTLADAPATRQAVALVIAAYPAVPDPNVAMPVLRQPVESTLRPAVAMMNQAATVNRSTIV